MCCYYFYVGISSSPYQTRTDTDIYLRYRHFRSKFIDHNKQVYSCSKLNTFCASPFPQLTFPVLVNRTTLYPKAWKSPLLGTPTKGFHRLTRPHTPTPTYHLTPCPQGRTTCLEPEGPSPFRPLSKNSSSKSSSEKDDHSPPHTHFFLSFEVEKCMLKLLGSSTILKPVSFLIPSSLNNLATTPFFFHRTPTYTQKGTFHHAASK